ncbi:hypothetical protein MC885_017042 [Smutsia gigantea]|nr:hypothetical protein MC885_017042 [Smutsia gigantea]
MLSPFRAPVAPWELWFQSPSGARPFTAAVAVELHSRRARLEAQARRARAGGMSSLRWGHGAAELGRALWPAGRYRPPGQEGAQGGRWGCRRSSSASPCEQEQDRRKDWGHAELLEVLEARVRQLQAECVSEVTIKRVGLARCSEASGFQPSRKVQEAASGSAPRLSNLWADRLQKDKQIMQRRQQKLEAKLPKLQARYLKAFKRPLRLEPQLLDEQLTARLQSQEPGPPGSPWEDLLARLLQEVPGRLGRPVEEARLRAISAQLRSQQQRILAFLECCLLTGHLPLAHHVLVTYHSRPQQQLQLTLAMYNTVMLGWARKGSFKELVYVFFMVKDAGLAPDLLSYAAALQCMGRLDHKASTIRRCLEQMAQDGLPLQDLFTSLPLCKEEQAMLLRAVRKARPKFRPLPPGLQTRANTSPLLREIYEDHPVPFPKLHLPLKKLESLFREQLHSEMATTITVQSVEKAQKLTRVVLHARRALRRLRVQWQETLCQVLQEARANEARAAYECRPSVYPFLCLLSDKEWAQLMLQVGAGSLGLAGCCRQEGAGPGGGGGAWGCRWGPDGSCGQEGCKGEGAGRGLGVVLRCCPPQALEALPPQGLPLLYMAQQLGLRAFNQYTVQRKLQGNQVRGLERRYSEYLHLLACDTEVAVPCLPRQHWESLGSPEGPLEQPWPLPVVVQLGKQLAEMMVQALEMPSCLASPRGSQMPIRVLYHVYSFRSFRQIGLVKPHPAYVQLLEKAAENRLTFQAADVPMLCPPLPWTTPHSGAFLLSPTKLMRAVDGTMQHQRLLESCPPAELHGALDALTQLGNCPWRVNGRVLDLVLELFTAKGCPRLGVPAPVSEAPRPPETRLPLSAPPASKARLRRELIRCLKVSREMHSLRVEALYRLSLAQHLRHHVFWLPHNMDFRGRAYPCPPHFNHLGSDLARALLEFAQGRPLGPHGLDWLKIHLINLTGLKKREPLQARLAFANDMMADILDSADRPMTVGTGVAAGPPSTPVCAGPSPAWLWPPQHPLQPPSWPQPGSQAPAFSLASAPQWQGCLWTLPIPAWLPCPLRQFAPFVPVHGLCSHPPVPPRPLGSLAHARPGSTARASLRPLCPTRPGVASLSAALPLQGRKWWMEADEPWQALACCMEITQAVRAPDPAAHVSHFPVHQDGSCNGLQHYTALGRDAIGAASVNLLPSDLPQDVYSGVAAQVEVFRRQDARRGLQVAQVLEGFISRKVVKQTVMTVVYGVTRYGGRLQIEKRLRELRGFPQEFVWEASHYLVRQVFHSLQEMFSGTRAIQRWLTESARLIARSGSAVEWITPLGIPIIQPYHRDCRYKVVGGSMQSLTFSSSSDSCQKPNALKQKNGFPPNFIHSLDSSHMMLTALHCYRKGLTFVSVHDCFWTHAADVAVMNQVCREQFVRLHSQPILQDLSRFLARRFSEHRSRNHSKNIWVTKLVDTLQSLPKTGDFDLEQVKHSTYFFS